MGQSTAACVHTCRHTLWFDVDIRAWLQMQLACPDRLSLCVFVVWNPQHALNSSCEASHHLPFLDMYIVTAAGSTTVLLLT